MRIALDATPLIGAAGGIPRYVSELALALAETFPGDQIHLLSDQRRLHIDERLRKRANVVIEPAAGPLFGGRWWSLGLPLELKRRRIDVFHGTDFAVPYLPLTPALMTVHDLSPWKQPPIRPPGSERVRRRTPGLLRLARLILTPSEAIRGDLAHLFRIAPEKIEAIPHAPSERLPATDPDAVTERLQKLQITRPYLLYLGSGEPRKNLATLIDAWRGARRTIENLDLVLVGPESVPCGEGPQPRLLGRCDDATVAAFLSGAAAFVYPSLYEGFGLPVLEAMQAGVAVIVSRDPALLETAGGAARDVDALSVADWRKAIVETVQSPDESNRLRSLGRERARSFQWSLTAKRTRAAYERAIRRP